MNAFGNWPICYIRTFFEPKHFAMVMSFLPNFDISKLDCLIGGEPMTITAVPRSWTLDTSAVMKCLHCSHPLAFSPVSPWLVALITSVLTFSPANWLLLSVETKGRKLH